MRALWRIMRGICACGLLLSPAVAAAEGFLDFAIGGSFTESSGVDFDAPNSKTSVQGDWDDSFSTGVRGGYWFEGLPWLGVGGMVSYFEPNVDLNGVAGVYQVDVAVVPITALLMLRLPLLESDQVPRGRLQPYLDIGPGAFITDIDNVNYSNTDVEAGLDLHAGLKWMFTPRFGMFGEYRFTHYRADLQDDVFVTYPPVSGSLHVKSTLDTHHVLVGFALHFN